MVMRSVGPVTDPNGYRAKRHQLPCGSFMVNPMMANTVKQNIARNVYQFGRLAHDLAGGFLATMPDQASFEIATTELTRRT